MTNELSSEKRIRAEIESLVVEGRAMRGMLVKGKQSLLEFTEKYQPWYTRALPVVSALLPDRLAEFRRQYERDSRRKVLNHMSYALEDFVHEMAPAHWDEKEKKSAAVSRLHTQLGILSSSVSRLGSSLANLRGVLQADLFDSEIAAAQHLEKNGHLRAAGAVAGVVLEGHLAELCARHEVRITKRDPHVSDFNDALKAAEVFDIPNWRWIQRLADIRNLCDHKKTRDPTTDEVSEFVHGVEKAIKTLR